MSRCARRGAAIVAGSDRKLSFGGAATATIAAGAVLLSDPVALDLAPLADLAVSVYLPGEILNDFQITGRYARQTNYVSPPGDFTAAKVMPIGSLTSDWFFVCGVDVLAERRHRRHRRARRLADRRQHLDDGRLLPLARPARPPPRRRAIAAGRWR